LFESIARLTTANPRRVLAVWLVLLLVCIPFARRIGEVLTTDVGVAPNSEAQRVKDVIDTQFVTEESLQLLLVAESAQARRVDPHTLDAAFHTVLGRLASLDAVNHVQDARDNRLLPSFSDTNRSSLAIINLDANSADDAFTTVEQIHALLPEDGPLELYLTGGPAVHREIQEISERDAWRAELIGLPISLVVLVFVFGAAVAATLPLLVAMASITLSMAVLYAIGQLMPMAAFGQIIVSMLGLATGIDYALLMVNRYREELDRGLGPRQAAIRTTETAGKAVTFSGLTVLVALAALLVPPLDFVRSMGVASITVMLFSVLVSVTALPALLALLGHRVNWLKISRRTPGTRSREFWHARALMIMRRPWLWTVLGVGALLIMSLPALNMQVAFAGAKGLTQDTDIRSAQLVLEDLGLDGMLHPFEVLVDFGERGFYHPSSVRAVSRLTRQISELAAVDQVYSPTTAGDLPSMMVSQYYARQDVALESPLRDLAVATVSQDGRYALVRVFPNSTRMPAASQTLTADIRQIARDLNLAARVGGDYVAEREWANTLYRSFPVAAGLVYLATFILLGLAFHSLLIPLKSILLNTLTVSAAFGVITAVFQNGFMANLFGLSSGLGFVETSVPIFIFAVVFGLSMDYEVFLVSRIVEGHQQGMTDRQAVVHALTATGGVISSAALIMVLVFSVFIFSNVVLIKTLSLGLSIAVLLDATLVRLALVPAVVLLAGKWNWWLPRPVARLAERVDLSHD
jgi:RND superfamily putative drug exporter